MTTYKISEVVDLLQLSADTLRYYEKICVIPKINRTASGIRKYDNDDILRIQFVQRAQKMNFTLAEITVLLKMRDDPQKTRKSIKSATRKQIQSKLDQLELHLKDLTELRKELKSLLQLCTSSNQNDCCPILEKMMQKKC